MSLRLHAAARVREEVCGPVPKTVQLTREVDIRSAIDRARKRARVPGDDDGDGRCRFCESIQGPATPLLGRVAHGIPNRVDRIRSLRNAVVPQVVAAIGKRILEVID